MFLVALCLALGNCYALFILLEVLIDQATLNFFSLEVLVGLGRTSCCTMSLRMLLNTSFKLLNQGRIKFLNS